jgi:hypothetical protein
MFQQPGTVSTSKSRKTMSEMRLLNFLRLLIRMRAEEFCERWYGLDLLEPDLRDEARQVRGYRAKCVRLLCVVLQKEERTVNNWGSQFERMPADFEVTLAFVDAIRLQIAHLPEDLIDLFMERYKRKEED